MLDAHRDAVPPAVVPGSVLQLHKLHDLARTAHNKCGAACVLACWKRAMQRSVRGCPSVIWMTINVTGSRLPRLKFGEGAQSASGYCAVNLSPDWLCRTFASAASRKEDIDLGFRVIATSQVIGDPCAHASAVEHVTRSVFDAEH